MNPASKGCEKATYHNAELGEFVMELLEARKECLFQSHVLGRDRLQNLSVKVENYLRK